MGDWTSAGSAKSAAASATNLGLASVSARDLADFFAGTTNSLGLDSVLGSVLALALATFSNFSSASRFSLVGVAQDGVANFYRGATPVVRRGVAAGRSAATRTGDLELETRHWSAS